MGGCYSANKLNIHEKINISKNIPWNLKSTVPYWNKSKENKESTQIEDFIEILLKIDTKKNQEFGSEFDIICNSCKSSEVGTPIYKCTKCINYSLCYICYEKRKISDNHLISHPMMCLKSNELNKRLDFNIFNFDLGLNKICIAAREFCSHEDIKCNYCSKETSKGIQGIRFYCDHENCINYNLCDECFIQGKYNNDHNRDHPILLEICPILYNLKDKYKIEENEIFYSSPPAKIKLICRKIIFKDKKEELEIINERNMIKNMNSSFFLKYYGYFCKNEVSYFCYESIEEKTLYDIIKDKENINLFQKFNICRQLISALRKLHSRNIFHLKLKPNIIYIDEQFLNIKITDSFFVENINNNDYSDKLPINYQSDIYRFGLIMEEIFALEFHNVESQIISQFFPFLISKCISKKKEKRPKAEEIEDYFLEFLQYFNSKKDNSDAIDDQFKKYYLEFIAKNKNFIKQKK